MVFEKIAELLAEKTGRAPASITRDTTFADLKMDSLDTVDTLMEMEDVFGVKIEISESLQKVGDVVTLIESAVGAQ